MKLISPTYIIETDIDAPLIYAVLEAVGRTCYKSEGKAGPGTAEPFLRKIVASGHESVLEHVSITVRFICDRGVSHELVRHRLAAFSQESTRYCNYSKDQFGSELTVINPIFFAEGTLVFDIWTRACMDAEAYYMQLLKAGASAQEARTVLPNSLKTEIVVTANVREWRHILRLRTSARAHPQMRQVMVPLFVTLRDLLPVLFDDIPAPPPL